MLCSNSIECLGNKMKSSYKKEETSSDKLYYVLIPTLIDNTYLLN